MYISFFQCICCLLNWKQLKVLGCSDHYSENPWKCFCFTLLLNKTEQWSDSRERRNRFVCFLDKVLAVILWQTGTWESIPALLLVLIPECKLPESCGKYLAKGHAADLAGLSVCEIVVPCAKRLSSMTQLYPCGPFLQIICLLF